MKILKKKMMTMRFNPWKKLENLKMIRVNNKIDYNIYWAKNTNGNYCLFFDIEKAFKDFKDINTKDLEIRFSESNLAIQLQNNENWEIFKIFCEDLIKHIESIKKNNQIGFKIQERILEWKNLLEGKMSKTLSFEEQMGLFSELVLLKKIIIEKGEGVLFWRGPEKDSQDFLCDNCAIEVKSSLSSQKRVITISSKNQLETEKENLYLAYCSLSKSKMGKNLTSLVEDIYLILKSEDEKFIFSKKLIEIGYDFKEENYNSFRVDKELYYIVKENFPKVDSKCMDPRILEVKYKIDLNSCSEFEVEEIYILEEI